jgi:hypothetical protein
MCRRAVDGTAFRPAREAPMSMFFTASATCPACEAEATLEYPSSVNADRRPDLREAILNHSLYMSRCPGCARPLAFEPHMTYLDVARGQWILAESISEVGNWREAEAEAVRIFDLAFGDGAPAVARTIGARLTRRLVFGWPALIEKLLCQEQGLDDAALEALKLAVLRDGPLRTISPTLELRLVGDDDDGLLFGWLDPTTGEELERLSIPEALYAQVKGDADSWGPLMRELSGSMFVDLNRVLRAPAATTA